MNKHGVYGKMNLAALPGAKIEQYESGQRRLSIPIEGKITEYEGKVYLPWFAFPKKIYDYDYIVIVAQTKEERAEKLKSVILGNAVDAVFRPPEENKPKPKSSDTDDYAY